MRGGGFNDFVKTELLDTNEIVEMSKSIKNA